MYCYKNKDGKILESTLSRDKEGCLFALFARMDEDFQHVHWKNLTTTRRAFKKLGFKVVEVKLMEVK